MKQISWRNLNKENKTAEMLCPEWLWITMFCLFIFGLVLIAASFPKFDPEMALAEQTAQSDARTQAEGQILPKNEVIGVSSWYDYSLDGIEWSKDHDTCAVRDYERYSMVRATNMANGKSVDCYVNDYGPETCEERIKKGLDKPGECVERIIDLSSHAFSQIADLNLGLINVKIESL